MLTSEYAVDSSVYVLFLLEVAVNHLLKFMLEKRDC